MDGMEWNGMEWNGMEWNNYIEHKTEPVNHSIISGQVILLQR